LLGIKLTLDSAVLQRLEAFFSQRKRPMPASTRVQAMVPEGAQILQNAHGTAPGLVIEINPNPFREGGNPATLVMLPGPPRELRPMFLDQVIPIIEKAFPNQACFVCRTLKTSGIGESFVEEKIAGLLSHLAAGKIELG
jgi:nicotinamide-nucleotide amidase